MEPLDYNYHDSSTLDVSYRFRAKSQKILPCTQYNITFHWNFCEEHPLQQREIKFLYRSQAWNVWSKYENTLVITLLSLSNQHKSNGKQKFYALSLEEIYLIYLISISIQ